VQEYSGLTQPSDITLSRLKADLRRDLRRRRAGLPDSVRTGAAAALADCLPGLIPSAAKVAGYWPMGSEIDPRPAMQALADRGHLLGLPMVVAGEEPLEFAAWAAGDPLYPGEFGWQPFADAPDFGPDVLLVPLVGFDADGYRLGQGGGFYDRTLAARPDVLAIGVAFECQKLAEAPRGPHDMPLDLVVTEAGVSGGRCRG
jgi:5-formyltetrahydrofolate cyclo-ligase